VSTPCFVGGLAVLVVIAVVDVSRVRPPCPLERSAAVHRDIRTPQPAPGAPDPPRPLFMAAAGVGGGFTLQPFVGFVSPLLSVIHSSTDAEGLAERLLGGDEARFVTNCFVSQEAAVCWVTDPVRTEAVAGCHSDDDPCVVALPRTTPGWLAETTPSFRSCFQLDEAGLAAALSLVRNGGVGPCVFHWFPTDALAWRWLTGSAGRTLLEVVSWGSGADAAATATEGVKDALDRRQPVVSATAGHTPTATLPEGDDPVVGLHPGAVTSPSVGQARSRRAIPRAPAAVGGLSFKCLPPATASPSRGGGGMSSRRSGMCSALGKRSIRQARHPGAAANDGHPKQGGSSVRSGSAFDGAAATKAVAFPTFSKKLKPSAPKDMAPGTALNPRHSSRKPWSGMLSMSEISKMMETHAQEWTAATKEAQGTTPGTPAASGAKSSLAPTAPNVEVRGALRTGGVVAEQRCGQSTKGALFDSLEASPVTPPGGSSLRDRPSPPMSASSLCKEQSSPDVVVIEEDAGQYTSDEKVRHASSPRLPGPLGLLANGGRWGELGDALWARGRSTFVSGGPGTGTSTLLRHFRERLLKVLQAPGEVVVVAPTGTSAKTAQGMTLHFFFGFVKDYEPALDEPAAEAARLLRTPRFAPIKDRLRKVRVLLLDEISLVAAEKLDVLYEMLNQVRSLASSPCIIFAFGDFLQLQPVVGNIACKAACWPTLFGGSLLNLTVVHRQHQPDCVAALRDARNGVCSPAVLTLMKDRAVNGAAYTALQDRVLHLVPLTKDVHKHNSGCLARLHLRDRPATYKAVDSVAVDRDRDGQVVEPNVDNASVYAMRAALSDCVAPSSVAHGLHAQVMLVDNRRKELGLTHGSIGSITSYNLAGTAVVRFEDNPPPPGPWPTELGVVNAGETWVEVECPPVDFTARILSSPGTLAVRRQVPFVLGWAIIIHMAKSLTLSEAVLDLNMSLKAGMVNSAVSRVETKERMYVKSFTPSRLFADPLVLALYDQWQWL